MNPQLLLLTLCQSLFLTNNVAFIAINGLVGLALAPEPWMATLPICAYVAGGALFTPLVARAQRAWGRQRAFQSGLLVAIASCALAAAAVGAQSFAGVLAATVLAGYYNASASLYRFAAVELVEPAHKERAISWVLTGGIVGAVAGPALAQASRGWLAQPFAGTYLALIGVAVLGLLLMGRLRFPPLPQAAPGARGRGPRELARQPVFVVAILASALGYAVMSLLMSATPIAMAQHGHGFGHAALVLEWHVLGMFVPSFFTGALIRRWGALPVMGWGVTLNVACVALALSGVALPHFLIALLVLGIGWNFLFVGATSLFTTSYRPEERTTAQATMDFWTYLGMTLSAFSSGALVTGGGWAWMNLGALAPLAVVGAGLLWLARRPPQSAAS